MQAAILQLYDPDAPRPCFTEDSRTRGLPFFAALLQEANEWARDGGIRLAFVADGVISPSLRHQFRRISDRYPNARRTFASPDATWRALACFL